MARIRSIKPEFWVDDVMVELSFVARLMFIGMWNFVDDKGFIEYKPKRLKMQIFPADNLVMEEYLNELIDAGRLEVFDSDQGQVLRVANWERHQKIQKPSPSRFTGITPLNAPHSDSPTGALRDSSGGVPRGVEGKGMEKEGRGHSDTASPPFPFCSRHQASEGTDHPCRACAVAWKNYEEWEADQRPAEQPYVHQHRWLGDGTCIGCEERMGDG